MKHCKMLCLLTLFCCCYWLSIAAATAEWPQLLGPTRNGIAAEQAPALLDSWPATGPNSVWRRTIGSGYAGVAIGAGQPGTVFLFERQADHEVISAIPLNDGTKTTWTTKFPVRYSSTIAPDDGPRCVPTLTAERVIVLGVTGQLRCLDRASGKEIWSRDTATDFNAPAGYFGVGSTPLVAGDQVIVNVGSPKGAGVVAFALADGKTLWQTSNELASYSAPILVAQKTTPRLLVLTRLNCLWLDPTTGKELSRLPFGARGPTVNAATPLDIQGQIFLTASYGIGATLVDIKQDQLQAAWSSDQLLSSQYTTPVQVGPQQLLGIHGRQDAGIAELRCIDLQQQKVLWTEPRFGTGHLLRVGQLVLIIKTSGEAVLLDASTKGYFARSKATLTTETVQALPAISDGFLVIRDTKQLHCFRVSK